MRFSRVVDRFSGGSDNQGRRCSVIAGSLPPIGDQSVAHASMQNNISHHTLSQEFRNTTTTFRSSADQSYQTKFLRFAEEAGPKLLHSNSSPSVYDVSDQSSKGLDLVDADMF